MVFFKMLRRNKTNTTIKIEQLPNEKPNIKQSIDNAQDENKELQSDNVLRNTSKQSKNYVKIAKTKLESMTKPQQFGVFIVCSIVFIAALSAIGKIYQQTQHTDNSVDIYVQRSNKEMHDKYLYAPDDFPRVPEMTDQIRLISDCKWVLNASTFDDYNSDLFKSSVDNSRRLIREFDAEFGAEVTTALLTKNRIRRTAEGGIGK
jgi:hypothetical protein